MLMVLLVDMRLMVLLINIVESTILYAISGKHIGLVKLLQDYRLSTDDGQYISTKTDGKKFIKLKANETVLQVLGLLLSCFLLWINATFMNLPIPGL